jgi:hypothetical protein
MDSVLRDNPKERWRDVRGYEGYYQVSSLGRVRSTDRTTNSPQGTRSRKGRILTAVCAGSRHARVNLSKDGKVRNVYVCQLVLSAFVGPAPAGSACCHKDGDPSNNVLSNLCWL